MGRIKDYLHDLESLWMDELYEKQDDYCKSCLLNPQDGTDWRRLR